MVTYQYACTSFSMSKWVGQFVLANDYSPLVAITSPFCECPCNCIFGPNPKNTPTFQWGQSFVKKKYSHVHAKIKNNHKNVTRWLLNDNLDVMKFLQCQNVYHDMNLIQQMHYEIHQSQLGLGTLLLVEEGVHIQCKLSKAFKNIRLATRSISRGKIVPTKDKEENLKNQIDLR